MKQDNLKIMFKIFIIALLFVTIYFIPFTHDDWAWGSSIGENRLKNLFKDYNGRWAGNLLVMTLTRNRLLKTIFITVTVLLIIKFISKIVENENKNMIYISSILLLLMPHRIIAQTIAWVSGFSNYVIPILLILIYIVFNKNIFNKQELKIKNIYILPMLFLGFITSLFVENITIYNVFLSIYFLIYEAVLFKKVTYSNIGYFVGSVIGTIVMFSNSGYANIFAGIDGYRTIEDGNIIIRAINTYFSTIYQYLIKNNSIIMMMLGVLALIISYRYVKEKNKNIKIVGICESVILIYVILLIVGKMNIFSLTKNITEATIGLLYLLAITGIIIICVKDKVKNRMLFEIISIVIMVAPLLIVTPIGPRNFYSIYVFLVLLACEMTNYLKIKFKDKYLMGIAFVLLLFYTSIFGHVYTIEKDRNNYLDEVKEKQDKIVLPLIPFMDYMQHPNPINNTFMKRFKLFYNVDNNKELIFIDYDTWQKIKK